MTNFWKTIAEIHQRTSETWKRCYETEALIKEACEKDNKRLIDLTFKQQEEIKERKKFRGQTLAEYDAEMCQLQKEVGILLEQGEILAHNQQIDDEEVAAG